MDETKTRSIPGNRFEPSELRSVAEAQSLAARPRLRVMLNEEPLDPAVALSSYLDAIRGLSTSRAQRIVRDVAERASAAQLIFEFVLPLSRTLERERAAGSLQAGHAQLITTQVRACLLARQRAIDVREGAPRVVVTSPVGHRAELGLLLAVLLTQGRGFEAVYLGAELPDDRIAWSATACAPQIVMIGLQQALTPAESERLAGLFASLPTTRVWIGGRALDLATAPRPARAFSSYEALDEALAAEASLTFTQP